MDLRTPDLRQVLLEVLSAAPGGLGLVTRHVAHLSVPKSCRELAVMLEARLLSASLMHSRMGWAVIGAAYNTSHARSAG